MTICFYVQLLQSQRSPSNSHDAHLWNPPLTCNNHLCFLFFLCSYSSPRGSRRESGGGQTKQPAKDWGKPQQEQQEQSQHAQQQAQQQAQQRTQQQAQAVEADAVIEESRECGRCLCAMCVCACVYDTCVCVRV